jgi:predicted nicotinamide N-methyase
MPEVVNESLAQQLLDYLQRTVPHGHLLSSPLPAVEGKAADMSLWLVDPSIMDARLSEEVISAIFEEPAYWSFAWASGQALARQLLDTPEWVAGKTVLDFGCGSGIAAIAAAKAGAKRVIACDLDPGALLSTRANAELNGVELDYLDDFFALEEPVDVLLAADVLYDWENKPLLPEFLAQGKRVIIADSRVRDFSEPGYYHTGSMRAVTFPDLGEFEEFKTVNFYDSCSLQDQLG